MSSELFRVQEILWSDEAGGGRLALEERDLGRAEELLTSALQRAQANFGEDDPRSAQSQFFLARLRHIQGRVAEAEQLDRASLQWRTQALGDEHPQTQASRLCVALFYGGLPEDQLLQALESGQRRFGAASWQTVRLLGRVWAARRSVTDYRRALATCPRLQDQGESSRWWARWAEQHGHPAEAAEFQTCYVTALKHQHGLESPQVAGALAELGRLHLVRGQPGLAETCLRRALQLAPDCLSAVRTLLACRPHDDELRRLEAQLRFRENVGYGLSEQDLCP